MKLISAQEAVALGIQTVHHEMDNGEKRFRLTSSSGSSYVLTMSSYESAWQNSHVHYKKREFYVVEQGWILLVLWEDYKQLRFIRLNADESFLVPVNVPHNVYMSKDTILHTIKYGTDETDWNACVELDELIKEKDFSLMY